LRLAHEDHEEEGYVTLVSSNVDIRIGQALFCRPIAFLGGGFVRCVAATSQDSALAEQEI
jgi:hypothetical protein